MTTTNKFAPETRKALVKALGEILQTKPQYLGVPTCSYACGEYTIAKNGEMTGPDSLGLMVALLERGFEPEPDKTFYLITPRGTLLCQERFDTVAEAEAAGYGEYFHHEGREVYIKPAPNGKTEHSKHFAVVGTPFEQAASEEPAEEAPEADPAPVAQAPQAELAEEPAADPAPEAPAEADPEFPTAPELDRVVIEYPLAGFTPQALDNLCKMVTAKEELIKLAIGAESLPIQVLEDRIAFPWLQTADPELVDALATFICALCKTALTKKRVTATPQPTGINDRYRFRCFMLHIGIIGGEYATARTRLLRDLSGNSGWLTPPPPKAPEAEAENVMDTADLAAAAAEVIEAAGGEIIAVTAAEAEEVEAHD